MHIFLTGPKRVGKSTLLNTIAEAFTGALGGFRTHRLNTWLPGQYSVHLFSPGEAMPAEGNLLFLCGRPDPDVVARFDRLGCRALAASGDADLLIMDELGPHEASAEHFQGAVRRALDGSIPILGVLQQAQSPFLEEIANHPRVLVVSVTEENRETLAERIPEFLEILTERGTSYG